MPLEIVRISVLRPISLVWSAIDGQRMMELRDVAYVLSATFLASDRSSVDQAGTFDTRPTFLGLRNLAGTIRRLRPDETVTSLLAAQSRIDLGWMLYDVVGRGKARTRFYRPMMIGGEIDVKEAIRGFLPA